MEKLEFIRLAEKVTAGTASDEEIALYKRYCSSFDQKAPLWEAGMGDKEVTGRVLKNRIDRTLFGQRRGLLYRLHSGVRVAASIVLALGIGIAAWKGYSLLQTGQSQSQVASVADIPPGSHRALLTLADGSTVALEDTGARVLRQGVVAIRQHSGELAYSAEGAATDVFYNTLTTPRGGQYRVSLPDGTRVWLNAASSLEYPTSFDGSVQRRVTLSGEGYFEVASDASQPFIVTTAGQEIRVLGTHFNIQAYGEDRVTRTTLLEGAVRVTAGEGEKVLRPGEQAVLSGEVLAVHEVATEDVVAWKNGYFMFNSETLESIMARVGRWYDVETVFEDSSLKERTFFGSISRYENISKLLKMLETTDVAVFEVKGNTVTIRKK